MKIMPMPNAKVVALHSGCLKAASAGSSARLPCAMSFISSGGNTSRYFTARPNMTKPAATIEAVTASSVQLGK